VEGRWGGSRGQDKERRADRMLIKVWSLFSCTGITTIDPRIYAITTMRDNLSDESAISMREGQRQGKTHELVGWMSP
jgi:hypothetical protein